MTQTVIINRMIDPSRKIVAIKDLRAATRPPEDIGGQSMGLKAAKDLVDALERGGPSAPVAVFDPSALAGSFEYRVVKDPENMVDRDLVLDFVLDALAYSDPESADRLLRLPTYKRLKDALR